MTNKMFYAILCKPMQGRLLLAFLLFAVLGTRLSAHALSDTLQQEKALDFLYTVKPQADSTPLVLTNTGVKIAQIVAKPEVQEQISFRYGPVEDFFMDWDTSTVDPYSFDVKEITYDFPICLFISPDDVYALPLKSLYKTSSFGPRWGRHHKGIDFDVNVGDSVFNMFDGMVRISTYSKTFGHFVVIRHFNGLETLYAHLSERGVFPGDILKSGECLGLGGNTGRSTGPHLHFEVRYRGIAFDPENLLSITCQDITSDELTIDPALFSYLTYYKKSRSGAVGASSGGNYHTIRQGETLGAIARKYGTTVNHLCRLNGMSANTVLRVGKQIRVR
jgi:murein DD-endopeptidase MepM/ murein hydrolase activator NlpD